VAYKDKHITIAVSRPVSKAEMDDISQMVDCILRGESFFWAGTDDVSDEIVRFLAEHRLMTNLEEVVED
jgi:hypothetical protein